MLFLGGYRRQLLLLLSVILADNANEVDNRQAQREGNVKLLFLTWFLARLNQVCKMTRSLLSWNFSVVLTLMNISSKRGNGLSCLTGLLFWDWLLTLLKSFLQATVLWLKSKLSPSIERLFLCCTENSVLKIKTEHKITPRRNRIPPTETTCLRFIFFNGFFSSG